MFFLFLARAGIERIDLWQEFFATADQARYRVLLHCKEESVCGLSAVTSGAGSKIGLTVVNTVPSAYCKDLVSPMVQLLRYATKESSSSRDKFVFVSATTLPVKPFAQVYSRLTADQDSDMCFGPVERWMRFDSRTFPMARLVKQSQWVVLNRRHADAMISGWKRLRVSNNVWSVPVLTGGKDRTSAEVVGNVNLCTDEWAIFATIFGAISDGSGSELQGLPGLAGSPLATSGERSKHEQGVCHTFAFFRAVDDRQKHFLNSLLTDSNTKLSCWPVCDGSHPAEFESISDQGLQVLRNSDYLFARKFSGKVVSRDQFQRIILGATASVHQPVGETDSSPHTPSTGSYQVAPWAVEQPPSPLKGRRIRTSNTNQHAHMGENKVKGKAGDAKKRKKRTKSRR